MLHFLLISAVIITVLGFVCNILAEANPDRAYKRIYRQIEKEKRWAAKQKQQEIQKQRWRDIRAGKWDAL